MHSWLGEFMDGRSAALRSVRVIFDGRFLLVREAESDVELARWDVAEVAADGSLQEGIVHLQVRSDPDALLTLRGADTPGELRRLGIRTSGLPRAGVPRLVLAAACVLGIAGFVTLAWVSVTPLSKAIAHRIPLEAERSLGGGFERKLARSYCKSAAATGALAGLSARLLGDGQPVPPVHILNLEMPNAFALPGGTVVLTRGLTELAEESDEVAGVLAHELAHVRERHVMVRIVRGTLLSALWAVTMGDYSGLMVVDPTTAFEIATLRFSREDEAEADREALAMLAQAGIGGDGLARFFERLEAEGGEIPEFLSSHPATGTRVEAAELGAAAGTRPALSPESWRAVQQACAKAPAPEVEFRDLFF